MPFVKAQGKATITVLTGQRMLVSSFGAGVCVIKINTYPTNVNNNFQVLQNLTNSMTVLGPYLSDTQFLIEPGQCDVEYSVGISPSLTNPAGQSSMYLGQVATRTMLPTDTVNIGNQQIQSRTMHVARDNITSLAAILPNFYATNAAGELGIGAAATAQMTFEYPAGTFTPVTFKGSLIGTIPNNGMLVSDQAAIVIPKGARFWSRWIFTAPATFGIPYISRFNQIAGQDGCEFGVTVTNKLYGGTVGITFAGIQLPPIGLISQTRIASIGLYGDSRVQGPIDTPDAVLGDMGNLARSIGPALPYLNAAIYGDTIASFNTASRATNRIALAQYVSHIIIAMGVNDITGGASAATALASLNTMIGLLPSVPIWVCTIEPESTSTDAWATPIEPYSTAGNQTTNANNAAITTFNNSIRAGGAQPTAGYFDISDAVSTSRNSGIWRGLFTTDGVHEVSKGAREIVLRAGINPALFTR